MESGTVEWFWPFTEKVCLTLLCTEIRFDLIKLSYAVRVHNPPPKYKFSLFKRKILTSGAAAL